MRRLVLVLACLLAPAGAAHAALPQGFVGIYGDDAFYGDSGYRDSAMSMQSRVGVGTLRQPLEWWRVEKRAGHFDFADYDEYVATAARRGMNVLPVLMGPPQFRSSRPPSSVSRAMFPPKSNAAYAAFVRAAVERYGRGGSLWAEQPDLPARPITSWQIWNEPNIPNFWRSGPDAGEYVALLREASLAIRAVDPEAEVVAAGLPNSSLGVPFLDYLEAMYDAGARGLFDTVAIHPYSPDVAGLLHLAEQARDLMDHHGDRSPIWITEFGWSTGGDASPFRVSERGQMERIVASLSGLVAERRALRLRGLVYFKWLDADPPEGAEGDPWPLHTGLLRSDGAPKPGFYAFAHAIRVLGRSSPFPPTPAGEVVISKKTVRLSPRGYVAVSVGCLSPRPGACSGILRLRTAERVTCGGRSRRAGSKLGELSFRLPLSPGIVPVRLSAGSKRLAECMGKLRVRATVARDRKGAAASSAPRGVVFTLRAR